MADPSEVPWRDTQRPVRLYVVDARLALLLIVWLFLPNWWTTALVVAATAALRIAEWRGYRTSAALRALPRPVGRHPSGAASRPAAAVHGLRLALAAALTSLLPGPAAAEPALPGPAAALAEAGAHLRPLGDAGGLAGFWVTPRAGDPYALYVTASGHAVAGLLYDPAGRPVTAGQLRGTPEAPADQAEKISAWSEGRLRNAAAPAPSCGRDPESERLFRTAAAAPGAFELGGSGREVVLFADTTCPWSRSTAAVLAGSALSGALRLTVVPVGVLGPRSRARAAAVVGAADPARAWFGAAEPAGEPGPLAARTIRANAALFDGWASDSVPLTVWRDRSGSVCRHAGDIADAAAFLAWEDRP